MSTNYFSPAGAAYVDRKTGQINTAFKREEYQKRLENIMEEPGYGKE